LITSDTNSYDLLSPVKELVFSRVGDCGEFFPADKLGECAPVQSKVNREGERMTSRPEAWLSE
jgi:hypothetical protein